MTAYATFDAEMRAALAAGEPNLDNVTDPDVLGAYGLEPDGDDEPRPYPCPTCGGNGCRPCGGTGERIDWVSGVTR